MEILENYLYEIKRYLLKKGRDDNLQEIRSQVMEMTETGMTLEEALTEMGAPAELARKYNKRIGYLVGPDLFGIYKYVVGFSILGVCIGLGTAYIVAIAFAEPEISLAKEILNLAVQLFNICLNIIGSVTVIFFLIQRFTDVKIEKTTTAWSPQKLKSAPKPALRVSVPGEVAAMVFTILIMVVFNFHADKLGIYFRPNGSGYRFVPIFNLNRLREYLVLLNPIWVTGLMLRLYLLVKRRQSITTKSIDTTLTLGSLIIIWFMLTDSSLLDSARINLSWIKPTTLPLRFVLMVLIILTVVNFVKYVARNARDR